MNIYHIHHVSLIITNVERSVTFYRDLLGLALVDDRPELGFDGAWFNVSPGQQIHLLCVDAPKGSLHGSGHGGRDRHLALWIDDLDDLSQRLEKAAISYTRSRSGRRALFTRDPDGNALEFIEQTQ